MILSRSGLVCWLMAMWLDWDCSCWTSSLVVFFSGGFVLDGPRERSRSRNGCSFSRGRDILLKSLNMLVWVIDLTFLKEYCVIRYIRTLNLSRTIWTVSSVWLWRIKLGGGGVGFSVNSPPFIDVAKQNSSAYLVCTYVFWLKLVEGIYIYIFWNVKPHAWDTWYMFGVHCDCIFQLTLNFSSPKI